MSRELEPKARDHEKPRVVEGEVLRDSRPSDRLQPEGPQFLGLRPSWLGGLAARAVLAAILGLLAAAFCVAGVVLTLTVIGAVVGLPLLLLGVALAVAAVWIFFGGGAVVYRAGHWSARAQGDRENDEND